LYSDKGALAETHSRREIYHLYHLPEAPIRPIRIDISIPFAFVSLVMHDLAAELDDAAKKSASDTSFAFCRSSSKESST
jgi:hypothetical protein